MLVNNNIIINDIQINSDLLIDYDPVNNLRNKNIIIRKYWTFLIKFMERMNYVNLTNFNINIFTDLDTELSNISTLDEFEIGMNMLTEETEQIIATVGYCDISNNNTIIISKNIYNTFINIIKIICRGNNRFCNRIEELINRVFWCVNNWNDRDYTLIENTLEVIRLLNINIPVVRYLQLQRIRCNETTDRNCIICLGDIEIGNIQIRLECGHLFHEECAMEWLDVNTICPLCRSSVNH